MPRARKVTYKNIKFDSIAERNYYVTLELLQAAGEISELEDHPEFQLQPKAQIGQWKTREHSYQADMAYVDSDRVWVIVDVKRITGYSKRGGAPIFHDRKFYRTMDWFLYKYRNHFNAGEWRYEIVDSAEV